jgi:hypothetical protein
MNKEINPMTAQRNQPTYPQPSVKGPAEKFAGDVWFDQIVKGEAPSRVRMNSVHVSPEAGRAPHDKDLTALIGELATRSEAFHTRWGTHDVRTHRGGIKQFYHPVVGPMELAYDSMNLVAAPGLVLTAYTSNPPRRPPMRSACWRPGRPLKPRGRPHPRRQQNPIPSRRIETRIIGHTATFVLKSHRPSRNPAWS